MIVEFIETDSRYKAKKIAYWAERITKVYGGYMAFESDADYQIWKNQK